MKGVVYGALTVGALYFALALRKRCVQSAASRAVYKKGAAFREKSIASMVDQVKNLPPPPANAATITHMNATDLVRAMKSGELKCVDVVVTFCYNAYNVGHLKLNAVTEAFFSEAVEAAIAADRTRAEHETNGTLDQLPLLFGLPMSIKDQFIQRGAASTMGCAMFAHPHPTDGGIVSALRALGAIPFVRSTAPQMLMLPETMSLVWGTTLNPYDPARSPGGSSGGESALIAARCSPLGLAGDVGGSLRGPAAACGLVTIKGSPLRFTSEGSTAPRVGGISGNEAVRSTIGIIGHTVADAVLGATALLSQEVYNRDPLVPRTYFNAALAAPTGTTPAVDPSTETVPPTPGAAHEQPPPRAERLRVGLWPSLGFWEGSTAELRAADAAAAALREAGHEVVDFRMDGDWVVDVIRTYYGVMAADGAFRSFREGLGHEPLHENYHSLLAISRIPACVRPALAVVLAAVDAVLRSTTRAAVRAVGGRAPTGAALDITTEAAAAACRGRGTDAATAAAVAAHAASGLHDGTTATAEPVPSSGGLLSCISGSICRALGASRLVCLLTATNGLSAYAFWQRVICKHVLTKRLLVAMADAKIDAFIAPSPPVALTHGSSRFVNAAFVTTFAWNLTHLPAGVVPVTEVAADDVVVDTWADTLSRSVLRTRVYEKATGLPVSAQIVGPPNSDEVVLRLMADIEARVAPPRVPVMVSP